MAKQTFTTGQVLTAAQVNALNSNDFNQTVSVKTAAHTLVVGDRGTRVEFNTSGSVTCTVNSGIFDAGDTLVIQNRGAGVVTVTAGTATVNTSATLALSQYDAGTLYFISASAAIFFNTDAGGGSPLTTKGDLYGFSTLDARIPIGANNTVLTADSSESLGLKWAAPAGGGKILQVVTATTTTATSITTTSYADITNITLTITPTSATSKIMILYSSNVFASISFYDDALPTVSHQLMRGASAIATDNRIITNASSGTGGNGREHLQAFAFHYIDSPATTSSTTYKFQAKRTTPGGTTSVSIGNSSFNQTITAFEIGA